MIYPYGDHLPSSIPVPAAALMGVDILVLVVLRIVDVDFRDFRLRTWLSTGYLLAIHWLFTGYLLAIYWLHCLLHCLLMHLPILDY
jgi:hypothetical protein